VSRQVSDMLKRCVISVEVYHKLMFLCIQAWNPATEDQCFDRCHRLGQTRDVVITKVSYIAPVYCWVMMWYDLLSYLMEMKMR